MAIAAEISLQPSSADATSLLTRCSAIALFSTAKYCPQLLAVDSGFASLLVQSILAQVRGTARCPRAWDVAKRRVLVWPAPPSATSFRPHAMSCRPAARLHHFWRQHTRPVTRPS